VLLNEHYRQQEDLNRLLLAPLNETPASAPKLFPTFLRLAPANQIEAEQQEIPCGVAERVLKATYSFFLYVATKHPRLVARGTKMQILVPNVRTNPSSTSAAADRQQKRAKRRQACNTTTANHINVSN
jgi:hypothetical protein